MGRPEMTATSANAAASSASSAGTPGSGPRPGRVLDDGGERPVEVEEQRAAIRLGGQRLQQRGRERRRVARGGQVRRWSSWWSRPGPAPMTTTTSVPVTPLTGVAVVSGSTWVGLTPMVVAMDAAGCCWPGRVVDGRRGLGGGRVDRRLHRPAAGADDRRVVRGQPVGARRVGHDDAGRAVRRGGGRRGCALVARLGGGRRGSPWWCSSSSTPPRRRPPRSSRWSSPRPPPWWTWSSACC